MKEQVVKALVGPLDITDFIVDYTADHIFFKATFWSQGIFTQGKLYVLQGSHMPRIGRQTIQALKLSQVFTNDIRDERSFPPLTRS